MARVFTVIFGKSRRTSRATASPTRSSSSPAWSLWLYVSRARPRPRRKPGRQHASSSRRCTSRACSRRSRRSCPALVDLAISLACWCSSSSVIALGVPSAGDPDAPVWLARRASRSRSRSGPGLAALNVLYRDVRYALPFLLQLWLFASPVVFPSSLLEAHADGAVRAEPDGRRASTASAGRWSTAPRRRPRPASRWRPGSCLLVGGVRLLPARRAPDGRPDLMDARRRGSKASASATGSGGRGRGYDTLREPLARGSGRDGSRRGARVLGACATSSSTSKSGEVRRAHRAATAPGKTTLLKLLARITEPTAGRGADARSRRRAARGRDRLPSRADRPRERLPQRRGPRHVAPRHRAAFDEIVDVRRRRALPRHAAQALLHRHVPAARLRGRGARRAADILVVDEVLAVGDAEFQRKCLGKMSELRPAGPHGPVRQPRPRRRRRRCARRVDLARSGRDTSGGRAGRCRRSSTWPPCKRAHGPLDVELPPATVRRARARHDRRCGRSRPRREARRADPLRIRIDLSLRERLPGLDLAILIDDERQVRLIDETYSDTAPTTTWDPGDHTLTVTLPGLFPAGSYTLTVWAGTERGRLLLRRGPRGSRSPPARGPAGLGRPATGRPA